MSSIYSEIILDYYRHPRNKGQLSSPQIKAKDSNPLCGDVVEIQLELDSHRHVKDARFKGQGCAISHASASMLTELVKGKSLDGTCPLGPWIVTADEIPDPQALRVRTTVNGVVKQDASTKQMVFAVARIVAELSLGMTLLPGDLILTGTPEGVGFARTPPEYLTPGDEVVVSVDAIGELRNRVAR